MMDSRQESIISGRLQGHRESGTPDATIAMPIL